MAFEQEVNLTKVGIEDFEITFFVPGPGNTNDIQSGAINFQILMSDGSIRTSSADLLARLADDAEGQSYLVDLANLKNYIRTRLNTEVLP